MVVKTFRGLLADDGQDRIRLSTLKGKTGYRIVKFQIIGRNPGAGSQDSVMKIYKSLQTTIDGLVNFADNALIGVAYWTTHETASAYTGEPPIIIFDKETFNQDIYVTHEDVGPNAQLCNYYIELEVVELSDHAAEYTTLKDIRSRSQ